MKSTMVFFLHFQLMFGKNSSSEKFNLYEMQAQFSSKMETFHYHFNYLSLASFELNNAVSDFLGS